MKSLWTKFRDWLITLLGGYTAADMKLTYRLHSAAEYEYVKKTKAADAAREAAETELQELKDSLRTVKLTADASIYGPDQTVEQIKARAAKEVAPALGSILLFNVAEHKVEGGMYVVSVNVKV